MPKSGARKQRRSKRMDNLMANEKTVSVMALITIGLSTVHLSQDIAYGIERGDITAFIATVIVGVWLSATLAFAGRRIGCALLLILSLLSLIVPLLHMSGRGVGRDIAASGGGLFFVWTLLALAVTAPVSFMVAVQGLWRLKQSLMSFVFWTAIPTAAGAALIAVVYLT